MIADDNCLPGQIGHVQGLGAGVPGQAPDNETLNTTPDMEYSTDGGKTWKPCPNPLDVSDLAGKDVLIRYPGKGDGPTPPVLPPLAIVTFWTWEAISETVAA